jgi:hypothetical protein
MNYYQKYLKYELKYKELLNYQIGGAGAPAKDLLIDAEIGDLVNLKGEPDKKYRVLSVNDDFVYTLLDQESEQVLNKNVENLEIYKEKKTPKKLQVLDLTTKYPEFSLGPLGPLEEQRLSPEEIKKLTSYELKPGVPKLDGLPSEIIFNMIKFLDCKDIMALTQTNRYLRDLIKNNIRLIYEIIPDYYTGIKNIMSIDSYDKFVQACGLLKNNYIQTYLNVMNKIKKDGIPDREKINRLQYTSNQEGFKEWFKILEPLLGTYSSWYGPNLLIEFLNYKLNISFIEFTLYINYALRKIKRKNRYEFTNLLQVISKYKEFKRNNPSIKKEDEFMLHFLIIEGAPFSFSYNLIRNISLSSNKILIYKQLFILLNLFDISDGGDSNIMEKVLNNYQPEIINTLKILKQNGFKIDQNITGILCIRKIKDILYYRDTDIERLIELRQYTTDIDELTKLSCFIYHNDESYKIFKQLLKLGVEIKDFVNLLVTYPYNDKVNKNKYQLYTVLRIKKNISHDNTMEFIKNINLKDKKDIIQEMINKYVILIKAGLNSSDSIYLIDELNLEQIKILKKYIPKFNKYRLLTTDVVKHRLFRDVTPDKYEQVIFEYLNKFEILRKEDVGNYDAEYLIRNLNLDQVNLLSKYINNFFYDVPTSSIGNFPNLQSQLKKYGKIDGKIPILNIIKDRVFKGAKPQEYKSRLLEYIRSKI